MVEGYSPEELEERADKVPNFARAALHVQVGADSVGSMPRAAQIIWKLLKPGSLFGIRAELFEGSK